MKLHFNSLFLFLILWSTVTVAQKTDTTWFTAQWVKTNATNGKYYRLTTRALNNNVYTVKEFAVKGKLLMQGSYSSLDPEVKEGNFSWWFESGKKKMEATYEKDARMHVIEWDEKGKVIFEHRQVLPGLNVVKDSISIAETSSDSTAIFFANLKDLPKYPGGDKAMIEFLSKNIKYPKKAAKANITGRVNIQFKVNKEGKITDATVMSFVHPLLDAEALRVVAMMPDWIPGTIDGKPVNVIYRIPINFFLK